MGNHAPYTKLVLRLAFVAQNKVVIFHRQFNMEAANLLREGLVQVLPNI